MPNFKIKLPIWLDKGEVKKLANIAEKYWLQVASWVKWPLKQFDPLTCHESILYLIAYQRDINRFKGEPLSLFRLRVKHAFINAQQSGELAGFAEIFKRLNIGEIRQKERQRGYEWDVILIIINDEQISNNEYLLMSLIRQYGRTCRRYYFEVIYQNQMMIRGGNFEHEQMIFHAESKMLPGVICQGVVINGPEFMNIHEVFTARI